MKMLSSLRSRIFLASALLAVLCIAVAISLVNVTVTKEAERTLEREIIATGAQVDQLRAERTQTFTLMARLIADSPTLKAAMTTNDPPTVQGIAGGYQAQLNASLVLVTNNRGEVLHAAGGSPRAAAIAAHQPAVQDALAGRESLSLLPQPNGILQVVTVPVVLDRPRHEILGTLSAGFLLDDTLASQLKQITGSDIAFGMDGQILASTLTRDNYPMLAGRLRTTGISRLPIDGGEYEVLPRPLAVGGDREPTVGAGPVALILRSRTEQLQSLDAIHTGLALTAVLAVALATLLSFAVARTIAQPLAAITGVMREVAATGDLTRKIALRHGNRWDDDDARLLATTFNTLTDSIARFQRQVSQKERLSSLGRLSTVIAHEVRNPLMIIKAALHSLRQPEAGSDTVREAAADIDGEVARLNRLVNEVLDFARPIRFELSAVSVNTLCRESASAAIASDPGAQIACQLDPALGALTTDPERLRIALVNLLVNARHAVNGNGAGSTRHSLHEAVASEDVARETAARAFSDPPAVALITAADADRVRITITDRGPGIGSADLTQIFDPYFTTKRGGTGLGLPIAKNIVEGLGGTIAVSSAPGAGTRFVIEFPSDSAQGRPVS
jgi:signal transduction histidine kinase